MPNPRGSYGQGESFTRANAHDFGHGDLEDILAGVDEVVKNYPVDDKRVGIGGWSYGGFMTMWTVTQTHRFRAAFAGAGIANWQSYYGENGIDQWMIPYFGASALAFAGGHVVVEPLQHAFEPVANVLRIVEPVPFAGINHEFRLHSQRLQRVPELVRLRRRALRIAIAHHHQRRRFHVLDERDRRAFRVHRRIVIHRRAEIRNHPLIDPILAVIALPIRDARARERRAETIASASRPTSSCSRRSSSPRCPRACRPPDNSSPPRPRRPEYRSRSPCPKSFTLARVKFFALPVTPARIRHEARNILAREKVAAASPGRGQLARTTDAGPPCTDTIIG